MLLDDLSNFGKYILSLLVEVFFVVGLGLQGCEDLLFEVFESHLQKGKGLFGDFIIFCVEAIDEVGESIDPVDSILPAGLFNPGGVVEAIEFIDFGLEGHLGSVIEFTNNFTQSAVFLF